eukprot:s641_g2.t1
MPVRSFFSFDFLLSQVSWKQAFGLSNRTCSGQKNAKDAICRFVCALEDEVCFNVTCRSYCLLCIESRWEHLTRQDRDKNFDSMQQCGYEQRTCEGER